MIINGKDHTVVCLDFETYYGRGYSLGRQDTNTIDYVCDDKFKIHCVGVQGDFAERGTYRVLCETGPTTLCVSY